MNTEQIYSAQLNVSKYYNDQTINDLINDLKANMNSNNIQYNQTTGTIDIICDWNYTIEEDYKVREIINKWVKTLPINNTDKDIICANNEYIYNIAKIGYPHSNMHIMAIYLS